MGGLSNGPILDPPRTTNRVLQIGVHRLNTSCAVVERSDHHCYWISHNRRTCKRSLVDNRIRTKFTCSKMLVKGQHDGHKFTERPVSSINQSPMVVSVTGAAPVRRVQLAMSKKRGRPEQLFQDIRGYSISDVIASSSSYRDI